MMTTRLMGSLLGCMFLNLNMTTCRSPSENGNSGAKAPAPVEVKVPGLDTSELTARERAQWSAHMTELLAPCENVPVHIAQCIEDKRPCASCTPAAEYLLNQVKLGRTKAQAEVAYRGRFAASTVRTIELGDAPIKGNPDAPITIVEWADFECPACAATTPVLSALIQQNEDVRLAYLHYPLSSHQNAEKAARAATAAGLQGKFWEMNAALFASPPPLTPARIDELAKTLGLDMKRFGEDLRSEKVADEVSRQKKEGDRVKLQGTPTIYINGRLFNYSTNLITELQDWIDLERKVLGVEAQTAEPAEPPAESEPKADEKPAEKTAAEPVGKAPAAPVEKADAKPEAEPAGKAPTAPAEKAADKSGEKSTPGGEQ